MGSSASQTFELITPYSSWVDCRCAREPADEPISSGVSKS